MTASTRPSTDQALAEIRARLVRIEARLRIAHPYSKCDRCEHEDTDHEPGGPCRVVGCDCPHAARLV